MSSLIFATHNENKLKEAENILGFDIKGTSLEIEEIQSLDNIKVATQKAIDYYQELKTALFVEDVSLVFNGLNGLPGPFITFFEKTLANSGMIKLLKGNIDRSAVAIVTIGYVDNIGKVTCFEGKVWGTITEKEQGTNGFGWDPIFIPDGFDKTFAEMSAEEKDRVSMRKLALEQLRKFLNR